MNTYNIHAATTDLQTTDGEFQKKISVVYDFHI